MLPNLNRLKLNREFDRVFKNHQSYYSKLLGIKAAPNQLNYYRCGILVSAKVAKKSVDRNTLKRKIRALITKHSLFFKSGYDYVIITLPQIKEVDSFNLEQDFINNIKSLNLN